MINCSPSRLHMRMKSREGTKSIKFEGRLKNSKQRRMTLNASMTLRSVFPSVLDADFVSIDTTWPLPQIYAIMLYLTSKSDSYSWKHGKLRKKSLAILQQETSSLQRRSPRLWGDGRTSPLRASCRRRRISYSGWRRSCKRRSVHILLAQRFQTFSDQL